MRVLALAALMVTLAFPALASQTVMLRADPVSHGPITLGDLFDNAGSAASIIVGPAPGGSGNTVLDAAAVQRTAMNAGLTWANEDGFRRLIVRAGGPVAASAQNKASGPSTGATIQGGVDVLTYNRSIQTGEIVQPEDLSWAKASAASSGAPRDADQIVGMAAKRPLRSGVAVQTRDVTAPQVIKRDDMVTVSFSESGVNLTMQGKATSAAAIGETLSVINPLSKKTIQAVASAPGRAVVGQEAQRLRSAALLDPSQLAIR